MNINQDTVGQILRDLGRPRMADIASEIAKTRLASALRKENVRLSSDYAPCEGREWQNVASNYLVADEEIRGRSAAEVVEMIFTRQGAALLSLLEKMEKLFVATAGEGANPDDWGTVILKGRWLKQTLAVAPGQPNVTAVRIDGTLAFVPKDELPVEADKPVMAEAAS